MTIDGLMIVFAGGLFVILCALLGWIGSRVHTRLDKLTELLDERLTEMNNSLNFIEKDLRKELSGFDRRLIHLETENGIRRKQDMVM